MYYLVDKGCVYTWWIKAVYYLVDKGCVLPGGQILYINWWTKVGCILPGGQML